MKNFLSIICLLFTLASCSNVDVINPEESEIQPGAELRATPPDEKSYEKSEPMWQYSYYENNTNSDTYISRVSPYPVNRGPIKTVDGRNYTYQYSDFNIMPYNCAGYTTSLYRYYTPTGKRHRLSTNPNLTADAYYNDYILDGTMGYIFTYQYPGTIPLKEFFISNSKEFRYETLERSIISLQTNTPGTIQNLGIMGYVYPGKRSEQEGKEGEVITFRSNGRHNYYPTRMSYLYININVQERLDPNKPASYKNLSYNHNLFDGEEYTIELPGAYTIMRMDMEVLTAAGSFYCYDMTSPKYVGGEYSKIYNNYYQTFIVKKEVQNNVYIFSDFSLPLYDPIINSIQ